MSRFNELIQRTPLATTAIIVLCLLVHLVQLIFDVSLHHVTLCPRLVVYLNEYYRIITSALFHGGMMHIAMNMVSAAAICGMLEKRVGTLHLVLTILWSILLTSTTYILIALILSYAAGNDKLMYQHSVGFSGVLFHVSVLECNLFPHRSRSLFGFVTVPSFLYPWALLFALQIFMPGLSFTGHLAGIIVGTIQVYGFLDWIFMGDTFVKELESWPSLSWLTARPNYVPAPNETLSLQRDPAVLREGIFLGIKSAARFVWHVLEAIKVIVFGRGREANANIQLSSEDDEEWAGLPAAPAPEEERASHMV